MKLLFFSNVFPNPSQPAKGVFNFRLVQALALDHQVQVMSPVSWTDAVRAQLGRRGERETMPHVEPDGFPVHYPRYYYPPKVLRSHYGWFLWCSVRRRLLDVVRAFRPDGVIGYWAHPDGEVAIRAARSTGVPAVVIVGGSDVLLLTQHRRRRQRILTVLHDADAVVTVSRHLRANLVDFGIAAAKIHVVYRGVDTGQFCPGDRREARRRLNLPVEGRRLLWVGRMVPIKGLEVLLDACTILRERGVPFQLSLVGDGPRRASLEADIACRGLSSLVEFAGPVGHDHLPDWYRAADLTVLPSHSEGVPNVLRESLACGTPFVASAVGGIPEITEDPDVQLVPPGDPPALAEAIARRLADGNPVVGPYLASVSWTESAHALVRVLQSLIAPTRNGTGGVLRPRELSPERGW